MRESICGYAHQPGYSRARPSASNGYGPPSSPSADGYPSRSKNWRPPLSPLQLPPPADSRPLNDAPIVTPREACCAQQGPLSYERNPYYGGFRGHPPPPEYQRRGQLPHDDYNRSYPPPRHETEYQGPPHHYEADYANGAQSRNSYAPYLQGLPQPPRPPIQQAVPRQRTSIACRHCRKRKVRSPQAFPGDVP